MLPLEDNSNQEIKIRVPYPTLTDNTAMYESNESFKLLDDLINAEIKYGFPSAQLVVIQNGQIIKNSSYGRVNRYNQTGEMIEDSELVTEKTLYDLASNTKMYVVNLLIQHYVSTGEISVDQKVSDFFPEFKDGEKDKIKGKENLTIRELLEHQGGFPPDPQYHNNNYFPEAENEYKKDSNILYTQSKEEMINKIIETPLEYVPGTETKYSDVDYILLGLILEKIGNKDLDTLVKEVIYQPLGLNSLTYNPLENGFSKNDIAATELNGNTRDGKIDFNNIRTEIIQGQVHDEKAYYAMNGISGHAGLFGTAMDISVLLQLMLNRGGYGEYKLFDSNTFDQFTKPKNTSNTYGLGWRRNGDNQYAWAFSPLASNQTVGHTGWTGTLTVIDPIKNIGIALFTNKKNSPVINNEENPHLFVGDKYLLGGYGMASTLIMNAILLNNPESIEIELINLVRDKMNLVKNVDGYNTNADKNSLKAIYEVLSNRADNSEIIDKFLSSEQGQVLKEYMNELKYE